MRLPAGPRWCTVRTAILVTALLLVSVSATVPPPAADALAVLRQSFLTPPPDSRIMMRWWWFGPAVTKAELARELATMKAGGIGGVEVQPVYPLEPDDASPGIKNLRFLSDEL